MGSKESDWPTQTNMPLEKWILGDADGNAASELGTVLDADALKSREAHSLSGFRKNQAWIARAESNAQCLGIHKCLKQHWPAEAGSVTILADLGRSQPSSEGGHQDRKRCLKLSNRHPPGFSPRIRGALALSPAA